MILLSLRLSRPLIAKFVEDLGPSLLDFLFRVFRYFEIYISACWILLDRVTFCWLKSSTMTFNFSFSRIKFSTL